MYSPAFAIAQAALIIPKDNTPDIKIIAIYFSYYVGNKIYDGYVLEDG